MNFRIKQKVAFQNAQQTTKHPLSVTNFLGQKITTQSKNDFSHSSIIGLYEKSKKSPHYESRIDTQPSAPLSISCWCETIEIDLAERNWVVKCWHFFQEILWRLLRQACLHCRLPQFNSWFLNKEIVQVWSLLHQNPLTFSDFNPNKFKLVL